MVYRIRSRLIHGLPRTITTLVINYCKPAFTISLDFKLSCFYFPQSQKLECQTKLKHLVNNIGGLIGANRGSNIGEQEC